MRRRTSRKSAKSKSKFGRAGEILRNLFVVSQLCQIFLSLAIGVLQFQGSDSSSAEARLRETLFRHYNKLPLPVKNATDRLDIMFDVYLQQLIDVEWVDHRLNWDVNEYDGVSSIIVPTSMIWTPDILIYNNAYGPFHIRYASNATINSNGTVRWLVPSVYKSACRVDVRFYPFDEQKCQLKFGSWTYNGLAIDLLPSQNPNTSKIRFWPNDEWEVELSLGTRNEKTYPCCPEPYIDVTFTISLQRKPLFYVAYLLLPCGLISFNTILVFYLPADCSEKMQLCTCILLSMAVFLLLISQQIPANANNLPLIMKYLLFTKIIVTSSIVLTTFILNMRFRTPETHELSKWQKRVFLDIFPKYLKMRRPNAFYARFNHSESSEIRKDSIKLLSSRVASMLAPMLVTETSCSKPDDEADERAERQGLLNKPSSLGHSSMEPNVSTNAYIKDVKDSVNDIVYITSQYAFTEETCKAKEEWKYCAMVFDRIFLIIYLCGVFVGTVVIILEAPLATSFFTEQLWTSQQSNSSSV
ncbi:neuronal acetylcholine receptor subunit alpha-3-like [Anneissia japonica]|uniref:neuronal acetylcholine receptor subunit alpha-3-like n=1 Tax=Anneissia japonica TaxID=1529436 RepID=UPI0014254B4A|nr:neuronal acetylcholine receptor subunit alpha-3-like [Anneissia japonica]